MDIKKLINCSEYWLEMALVFSGIEMHTTRWTLFVWVPFHPVKVPFLFQIESNLHSHLVFHTENDNDVPELPEDITCDMKTRLICCIFCKCQILASPDLAKYVDHLQVSLADHQ